MPPFFSGGGAEHSYKTTFPVILLLFIFVLLPTYSKAQRKADIGLIGGTSYYMGDVNPTRHFYAPSVAGGLIYRYNLNPRNSFRFSAMYTSLKGSDSDFTDAFQGWRGHSFSTGIIDLGLTTEFNFRDYQPTKLRKDRYSPYVCAGIGFASVISSSVESASATLDPNARAKSATTIIFGGGFKYNLARRWSIGGEWTYRKTLRDLLDARENIGADNGVFFHNNDWYCIIGIFITYKIFNWREDCPAYD